MEKKELIFSQLDYLYGAVVATGQAVISNNPQLDPRRGELPNGHPPFNAFIGLPFYLNDEMLGMVGLANCPSGYQPQLENRLNPFLTTCSNVVQAYRHQKNRHQIAAEFEHIEKLIALGNGYEFSPSQPAISKHGQLIMLTKKELVLLTTLVENRNQVVSYKKLYSIIWGNIIVGESSLRSLVRKLRKKLPELDIKTISGVGYILSVGIS